ncbi:MAG TPA: GMC family oxidoreductase [Jatrophihabitans sp.]|jgi:choline dehydrogenase|nr:GMC family oxidoreductase [Jatrophihabitans sp.]
MRIAFDSIVVGGGSAGAIVAARLATDPAHRVLLIEAGPHYRAAKLPSELGNANAMALASHSWGMTAQLTGKRKVRYPQAKVTGGGSAVGNTVAIRPLPEDLDEWCQLGNPSWSWQDCLPILREMEDDQDFSGPLHGQGGPTPIRRFSRAELAPVQAAFYDQCVELGYPVAPDHNHPASTGVGPMPTQRTTANVRVSTALGYLEPPRDNLTIWAHTLVSKVLIDAWGVAHGVEILNNNETIRVQAGRIVLCAGAIMTPAILQRSGIGDPDEVCQAGVAVRIPLTGVGKNLLDQPRVGVFLAPKESGENLDMSTGQVVLRTTSKTFGENNDLYYAMVSRFDLSHHFPQLRNDPRAGAGAVFGVMAVARRPRSRGSVRALSPDPHMLPDIDLGYLSDPEDLELLTECLAGCWDLASTPRIGSRGLGGPLLLEAADFSKRRTGVRKYLRATVDSAYNPAGTARMAPVEAGGVVDETGLVHGAQGLWVADASVFPTMVRANINLTVMLVAERISRALVA